MANIFKKFPNLLVHPRQFFLSFAVSKRESARWARHARAGSQSERSIHFILPTGAACHMVTGDIPQFSNLSVNHDKSLPLKCIQDERMFCDRYRRRDIFVFSLIRNREH